jgi:outer membrane protein OmpA-like peptidoglycan-associated protein
MRVLPAVVLLALAQAAWAGPAASGLPVPSDGYGLLGVDRADIDPPGEVGVRLELGYLRHPLQLSVGGQVRDLVANSVPLRLGVHIGVVRRLEVGLWIPVSLETYTQPGAASMSGAGASTRYDVASGDLRLFLKVAALTGRTVGLSVVAGAMLLTGDQHSFRSDGEWGGEARLVLDVTHRWFGLIANAGTRVHDTFTVRAQPGERSFEIGPELLWGLGLTAALHPKVSFAVEAVGSESLPKAADEARTAAVLGSFRVRPAPGVDVYFGGGRSVAPGAARTDDFRLTVGVSWHPLGGRAGPVGDRDGDGIPDDRDACPDEPEDHDGFQDQDGCPDPDNDGDGVPDVRDRCPNEPEDHDGFADDDGCPDLDNDGDGVPDASDKCPNTPEPTDGFQDGDGCPDQDIDGDGIPNDRDACPYQPETKNGFNDEDGCPDVAPEAKIAEAAAALPKLVTFANNSARLDAAGMKTVEALATFLRDRPELRRVRLEGHADKREHSRHELAKNRARAVHDALVKRGIETGRITVVGYASERPVGEAAANRRVEWVIVDQPK